MNMTNNVRKNFKNYLKELDIAALFTSFLLATFIASILGSDFSLAEFLVMRVKVSNFFIIGAFILISHLIFIQCGLYLSKYSCVTLKDVLRIAQATLMMTCFLMLIKEIDGIEMIDSLFIGIFWVSVLVNIILNRIVAVYFEKTLRLKGLAIMNVLFIGTNDRAMSFAKKINDQPNLGYRISGFIDDAWSNARQNIEANVQVIATLEQLPEFLRNNPIDEIFIFLPMRSFSDEITQILTICEVHGIAVRVPSEYFTRNRGVNSEKKFLNFGSEEALLGLSLVTYALPGWQLMIKRFIDIIISTAILILVSPILLVTGILIKITSRGPIFFIQERVGFNKRIFKMFKFRTMVVDAEKRQAALEKFNEASGAVFKIKNDPRITPIGKFLRKSSIDELPQLINVLIGNMSLVGPRPLPIRDYQNFNEDWQRRRFSVKPGITCIWQIKGRSDISFDSWMKLDLQYIDNWSLWLDSKILFGTISVVIKGSGAS